MNTNTHGGPERDLASLMPYVALTVVHGSQFTVHTFQGGAEGVLRPNPFGVGRSPIFVCLFLFSRATSLGMERTLNSDPGQDLNTVNRESVV